MIDKIRNLLGRDRTYCPSCEREQSVKHREWKKMGHSYYCEECGRDVSRHHDN